MTELGLGFAVALLSSWIIARASRARAPWLLVLVGVITASIALSRSRLDRGSERAPGAPGLHRDAGYVGSGACRECHPSEHDSFSQTYHRTMTRRSSALAWNGQDAPRLPAHVEAEGRSFDLFFDDSSRIPRVTGPSMHEVAARLRALSNADSRAARRESYGRAPSVTRAIPLVTGSHHYLAFWVESGERAELRQLPFVYLLEQRTFAPRNEVFLQPEDAMPHVARWNGSCIQCHSVAGMPKESDGLFDTQVAELGISCEACHGPGRVHADSYRSPFARYAARHKDQDESLDPAARHSLSPARLPAEQSSALCGQCHSYFVPEEPERWWETGFVESAALLAHSGLGAAEPKPAPPELPARTLITWEDPERASAASLSRELGTIFWKDGTVLVGGREYNGLIRSACYERGQGERKLGCLSCHSMHSSEPNDQLKPNFESACGTCHPAVEANPVMHSHHPSSVGCVDCHMPKTSYALMKSIASHRITTPRFASVEPPSACVLCHTTKSAAWLEREGARLFALGSPPGTRLEPEAQPEPQTDTHQDQPVAGYLAIAGGAVTRALLANALVEPSALTMSGKAYATSLLEHMKDDPYPVVRRIAARSLGRLEQADAPRRKIPPPPPERLDVWLLERDTTVQIVSE